MISPKPGLDRRISPPAPLDAVLTGVIIRYEDRHGHCAGGRPARLGGV